jgi:hypothetical protein
MRAAVQAVLALSRQLGIKPPPVDLAAAMRDGSTVLVNLPGIGECECFVAEAYNRTTDRADYGYAGNWLAPQARELSCDIRLVVSRRLEQPYLIERVNRPGRRKKP